MGKYCLSFYGNCPSCCRWRCLSLSYRVTRHASEWGQCGFGGIQTRFYRYPADRIVIVLLRRFFIRAKIIDAFPPELFSGYSKGCFQPCIFGGLHIPDHPQHPVNYAQLVSYYIFSHWLQR